MTLDPLAALLLDPFLTTGEVERELAALQTVRRTDTDRRPVGGRHDRPHPTPVANPRPVAGRYTRLTGA